MAFAVTMTWAKCPPGSLSALLGFTPSAPETTLGFGKPTFQQGSHPPNSRWHNGTTFVIVAHGNSSPNCYIQSAQLNGKPLITHVEITSGGMLEFVMGSEPNLKWGHQRELLPGCFLPSHRGARMARRPQS